jgi:hypothetical protein
LCLCSDVLFIDVSHIFFYIYTYIFIEAQLQEEINTMETLQEHNSIYIQEQIQMYENEMNHDNYQHQNQYQNQYQNLLANNHDQEMKNDNEMMTIHVPCPLCHHGNLMKDSLHGIIHCQYYSTATNHHHHHQVPSSSSSSSSSTRNSCKLCLNPTINTNINGLSLEMLKHKLCQVYQEHSATSCLGVLCFDVLDVNGGLGGGQLVVGCSDCGARAVVV